MSPAATVVDEPSVLLPPVTQRLWGWPAVVNFAAGGLGAGLYLVAAVAGPDARILGYAAGGFRDTTRIAASSGALWREVFELNRGPLLEMLTRYREELDRLEGYVRRGAWDALETALEAIRRQREGMP